MEEGSLPVKYLGLPLSVNKLTFPKSRQGGYQDPHHLSTSLPTPQQTKPACNSSWNNKGYNEDISNFYKQKEKLSYPPVLYKEIERRKNHLAVARKEKVFLKHHVEVAESNLQKFLDELDSSSIGVIKAVKYRKGSDYDVSRDLSYWERGESSKQEEMSFRENG